MTLQYLKPWTLPANYSGEVWPATYSAGVGQSRDSGPLERANFDAMVSAIGGESETVTIVREGHWAVGWIEWIAIHQDDETALQIADRIIGKLEDYPIIDEDLYSRYEDDDCAATWANCYSPADRAAYLRAHVHTVYPSPVCRRTQGSGPPSKATGGTRRIYFRVRRTSCHEDTGDTRTGIDVARQ